MTFMLVVGKGEGRDDCFLIEETHGRELPMAISSQD
jgi:hypothetical protein